MKRIQPSWWVRLRSGWKVGGGLFLGSFAVGGTVATFISSTGNVLKLWEILTGVSACCVLGIVGAYVKGRLTIFPDAFVDELGLDGQYQCRFCTNDNLREACELTRPSYQHEYVEPEKAQRWLAKNPKAFVEILNAENVLCAAFGIMALEDSFMAQFIKGRLDDLQLEPDDICSTEAARNCKRLYISGVVVRDHRKFAGQKRARVMIWVMLQYIKDIYGIKTHRTLYAVAVTKESERLMKNLRFSLVGDAKGRKDHCCLYSYELTASSWQKMLAAVGDWSKSCHCSFS